MYLMRLAKAVSILLLIALLPSACMTETVTPSESPTPPGPTEVATDEIPTLTPLADVTPEETATTVPPQLESGKGAIIGTVLKEDGTYPPENVRVFLASFFWNEEKTEGVFVLDPDRATSVPISDQGAFQLFNIEPGNYVLVVGVTPEAAVAILGDRGQARVIEVNVGEVVDIGEQRVSLP
jgi:hypothetical protein